MIRCGYCMAGGLTRQRCLTADERWQSQSDMSEQMEWDTRCSASQSSARKLVTCFMISCFSIAAVVGQGDAIYSMRQKGIVSHNTLHTQQKRD